MPVGASIILGNNGYVWISPTANEEDEKTGGYETNLQVGRWFVLHMKQFKSGCDFLVKKKKKAYFLAVAYLSLNDIPVCYVYKEQM